MSLSQLSDLSATTAISIREDDLKEFSEKSNTNMAVFVAVDDQNLTNGVAPNTFHFDQFVITIQQAAVDGVRRVWFGVASAMVDAEWQLLVQLRIKTGVEFDVLNVVDKDVFKFDRFQSPLVVEVDSEEVKYLKFEMRVLNLMHLELPKFNEGDRVIQFEDGSEIRVHANILATLSSYMAGIEKVVASRGDSPKIIATATEKEAFVELLYQAYPTRRPIYADFRRLSTAAVGYSCEELICRLSRHLIEYNFRPLSFRERLHAAIENRLTPAVKELVYKAARDGVWDRMIRQGFEPEQLCGREIYTKVVCPTILAARNARLDSSITPPYKKHNFLEKDADDMSKETILFRGTKFYVNGGLLAAHGRAQFYAGQNGEYIAKYSNSFQRECQREALLPGEVLLQLLAYMVPFGEVPHPTMIRACIAFCHDHEWQILKENLEQELEPPTTADEYMSQLVFAEKFGLKNLLRVNIQRAESSCRDLAERLEREGVLKALSDRTRELIMDRMCSGWGLNPQVNRLATRIPTSFTHRLVNLQRGRALVIGEGRAVDTLNSIHSEYAFGEPEELVVLD